MASPLNAALCALVATVLWSVIGYAVSRHLLPRSLAVGSAPVMGWAVHSTVTLLLFTLIGFTPSAVIVVAAIFILVSLLSFTRGTPDTEESAAAIPIVIFATAALLALAPAAAIVPKFAGNSVWLADPIYDHSKIVMIDAMIRQGLPPVDPALGMAGEQGRFIYYYLWHYSAAGLALALGKSGWEADIALTWFTAFASLSLIIGIAVWLSRKSIAAVFAVVLAAAASLRLTLLWLFGADRLDWFLAPSTGFAGWLFQASWAPQHLMAASCAVTAMLLIARYAERQRAGVLIPLALLVVAGFESSAYVGGITFAIAALAAAPLLLLSIKGNRIRFLTGMSLAAIAALIIAAPFLDNQIHALVERGDPDPVIVEHFAVLGPMFGDILRRVLDLPAYWLVLLPVDLPAIFIAGTLSLFVLLRRVAPQPEKLGLIALACLTGAGLFTSWLLASTVGDIDDLGLRAVLPVVLILIALSAVGLTLVPCRKVIAACAIGGLLLSLPDTVRLVRSNVEAEQKPDSDVFAQTPELWAAVRRYAGPAERVANNPHFLQDTTPWPVNISWALLADRSSCFAGFELTLALAALPTPDRTRISAQFTRVFDGEGSQQDVDDFARLYGCDVVVLVPQDGAWSRDPFASNPNFHLAENRDGKWRIYTVVKPN